MTPAAFPEIKNVYTPEEFAAEILLGKRGAKWVRAQCHARKIKTITKRPFLIPRSEAIRFIDPDFKAA